MGGDRAGTLTRQEQGRQLLSAAVAELASCYRHSAPAAPSSLFTPCTDFHPRHYLESWLGD